MAVGLPIATVTALEADTGFRVELLRWSSAELRSLRFGAL